MSIELTPEQYEELDAKVKGFPDVHFPPLYWFDDDPDNEYCAECAKLVEAEHPDWQKDGGWVIESDNAYFCERCGKVLDFYLTYYGKEQELAHFKEYGADLNDELMQYILVDIAGGWLMFHQEELYEIIFGGGAK